MKMNTADFRLIPLSIALLLSGCATTTALKENPRTNAAASSAPSTLEPIENILAIPGDTVSIKLSANFYRQLNSTECFISVKQDGATPINIVTPKLVRDFNTAILGTLHTGVAHVLVDCPQLTYHMLSAFRADNNEDVSKIFFGERGNSLANISRSITIRKE